MKRICASWECVGLFFLFWISCGEAQQTQQPPPTAPPPTIRTPQAPPPPLPQVPDVRQPGETGYSVGIFGWFPIQEPSIIKGRASEFTDPSNTKFSGKPKHAEGAEIGIALGLHNALRLSYFQDRASGTEVIPTTTIIWDKSYDAGTKLLTTYRLQNAKISFDYLTWPYPVESRKFRLKTLWQLHYTSVRTSFNAPDLPLFDSAGNAIVDITGTPVDYHTQGSKWYLTPAVGLGIAEYASRHFRLEGNLSGFAIPHHTNLWDADASANIRYGHWELRFGAKAFHFQTSTKADFYVKNTLGSAFAGIRWYSQ